MAFTKITNAGFGLTTGTLVGVAASFSSTVSVGGTLTYEDVTNVDSVGLITARNGIEVTDKGVQVGTGATVDSAAANTLTFLTGGSERVRVKSDGFVGINDSNPDTRLSVNSGTTDVVAKFASSDANAWIQFRDNTTTDTAVMVGANGDNLLFRAGSNERARITSRGDVGINCTPHSNAGINLHIHGDNTTAELRLTNTTTGTGANGSVIQQGGNSLYISNSEAGVIAFENNGSERARIDSSGSLLVNTSTSRSVMDQAGNGPTPKFQIEGEDSEGIMSVISAGDADANRCGTINLGRHRNGTVGGTPTIVQNGDALGAVVFSGGDGGDMLTCGAKIHAVVDGAPGANDMPGALLFSTTPDGQGHGFNTERMRIASDGQVYIGGSSENSNSFSDAGTFLNLKNDTYGGRIGFSNNTATAGVTLMEQFAYWGNNKVAGIIAVAGTDTTNKDDGLLAFYTRTSGSSAAERARIDSAGRLLVGNTSTTNAGLLCVKGSASDSTGGGQISVQRGQSVSGANQHLGDYNFGEGNANTAKIRAFTNANWTGSSRPTYMTFETTPSSSGSPTERMRIDSDGRLIAGMTTTWDSSIGHQFRAINTSGWALNANSLDTGGPNHLLVTTGRDTSGDNMIRVETNHGALGGAGTTLRFKVDGGGNVFATNTTIQSASDERLKENIRDSEDGLAVINQLRPVRFDWRQDQTFNQGTNQLGFIAQEVEAVFPEAVGITPLPSDFTGDDPEYKTVGPGTFIPVLVKALQEASAKIESLEARLDAGGL